MKMGGRIDRVAQLKVEGLAQGEKRVQVQVQVEVEGPKAQYLGVIGSMGGGLEKITCSGFEPLFTHSK